MIARASALLLGAVLLGACRVEFVHRSDSTKADTAKTRAAAPVASSSTRAASETPPVIADTLHGLAVDSALPNDSTPINATAAELAELRGQLVVPVQGVAPSDLHDTYSESRGGRVHEALDIMAPRGTPVLSAADGRLMKLHESVAGGHMIYAADASDRFILMYAHLERYADGLTEGMPLRRGQVIGYVGSTGDADAASPHLHFALARGVPSRAWWRGTPVNPFPLLAPAGGP